jgi:hypothetical protein
VEIKLQGVLADLAGDSAYTPPLAMPSFALRCSSADSQAANGGTPNGVTGQTISENLLGAVATICHLPIAVCHILSLPADRVKSGSQAVI